MQKSWIEDLARSLYAKEGETLCRLPYAAQMRRIGELCDVLALGPREATDLAVCLRAKVRKDAPPADAARGRGIYR